MPSNARPQEQPSKKLTPSSSSSSNSFADSLLALKKIAGYSVDKVLGSGTYGLVLRATHEASGTLCALKIFKTPLVRTDSASLDSAWSSLATEARALELLGAAGVAPSASASASTAAIAFSSSCASASLSSAPTGIPRLFEYGILKANSRSRGPGGAMGEEEGEEEENSSVDATDGGSGDGEKQHDADADADDASDKKKESPSPAGAAAEASPSADKDPSPDAVCYAWMATELLGSDLWHLMRAAKQRAKAEVASASASSSGATAAAAAAAATDETLQRRACKLACRALLVELAPAMLGALEQVHARGLVHRDVKLDNFAAAMASEGGEKGKNEPSAFLLDFGGVAAAPSLAAGYATVAHACKGKKTCFFGTPEYCSSTAFTGESPPAPAQDVEALGYCLLELWGGGRLPWGEAFRARRETETGRWSSSNLREMRLARDADWERAVRSGAVPWWLDAWITHAKQQQDVFAGALAAAVARASGGGAAAAAAEGAPSSSASPPAAAAVAPGGEASPPGMPNYRLLRSLLKAAAAQASAEAEVAEEAAAKGRVVAASAHRFVKMEE